MHESVLRIGGKFLANYLNDSTARVLEIGSYDVNGSLRMLQPNGSIWTGVDIEKGPGVDVVVEPGRRLPFDDNTFDAVVATSVFEHDPAFWKTLREMARVVNDGGAIYVSAPSNGMVHRFPLDCFRFYPDASVAFLEVIRELKPSAEISESFVGYQDMPGTYADGRWNDFVAVFTMSKSPTGKKIFQSENCSNVWSDGKFLKETEARLPEDQETAQDLLQRVAHLTRRVEELEESWSWKLTSPLRLALRRRG